MPDSYQKYTDIRKFAEDMIDICKLQEMNILACFDGIDFLLTPETQISDVLFTYDKLKETQK